MYFLRSVVYTLGYYYKRQFSVHIAGHDIGSTQLDSTQRRVYKRLIGAFCHRVQPGDGVSIIRHGGDYALGSTVYIVYIVYGIYKVWVILVAYFVYSSNTPR